MNWQSTPSRCASRCDKVTISLRGLRPSFAYGTVPLRHSIMAVYFINLSSASSPEGHRKPAATVIAPFNRIRYICGIERNYCRMATTVRGDKRQREVFIEVIRSAIMKTNDEGRRTHMATAHPARICTWRGKCIAMESVLTLPAHRRDTATGSSADRCCRIPPGTLPGYPPCTSAPAVRTPAR